MTMLCFLGGPAHGREISADRCPTKYLAVPVVTPSMVVERHEYERSGDLLLYIGQ
jgi:hypothetical protein